MVHEGPSYTKENCPLCKMAITQGYKIVVVPCLTHPDCWMIVWGDHVEDPGPEVKKKLRQIMEILFPGIKLRDFQSSGVAKIPEHYHLHQEGPCKKRKVEK